MQPDAREPYSFRDDPAVPEFDDSRIVVVMDADCALCSQAARRIALLLGYNGWLDVAQAADESG